MDRRPVFDCGAGAGQGGQFFEGAGQADQGRGRGIFGTQAQGCRLSGAECKPGTRNGRGLAGWREAG